MNHKSTIVLYPRATFQQNRLLINCDDQPAAPPPEFRGSEFTMFRGSDVMGEVLVEQRTVRTSRGPEVYDIYRLRPLPESPELYPGKDRVVGDSYCWVLEMKSLCSKGPEAECRLAQLVRQTAVGWEPYLMPSTWILSVHPEIPNPIFHFDTRMYFHPRLVQGVCAGGFFINRGPRAHEDINDFIVSLNAKPTTSPCYYTYKY
jgi:hypothetical protein